MKEYIKKLLEGDNGEKSTRRLAGILLISIGLSANCCLMIVGALAKNSDKFTMYDKIDGTAYNLIMLGAGLLVSTTLDKFKDIFKK
jgi:hypothetical protein